MNKQELQQKIEEAKANIEIWTKELEKPYRERWEPKEGERYFSIHSDGRVIHNHKWSNDAQNKSSLKIGNVFKTREEAEKERDRRLAEVELLDMCDEGRYSIMYDTDSDEWNVHHSDYMIFNMYRFATQESCQKAIDTLGAEKLKLIFRVE